MIAEKIRESTDSKEYEEFFIIIIFKCTLSHFHSH